MSATFLWYEDNGAATGSPAKGTTRTGTRTDVNWKNIDDSTTAYSAAPITAGSNSYEKWQSGNFSGTFNQILAGLWAHTAGTLGANISLFGVVGTAYTTPATAANSNLTVNMTSAISIGSGQTVQFGATGPEASGKGATTTTNPSYTQYLTSQLQSTSSAAAGDTGTATLSLQYSEN